MPTRHLTDLVLRNAAPPETGQYVIWDKSQPGFGIRVSQGGTRSYVVMFRNGNRKTRVTIGTYPALSLSEARAEARRILASAMLDRYQPHDERQKVSFETAVDQFVETHCKRKNREVTARETERLLRRHFLPHFGRKTLSDIRTQDITQVIDRLMDTPSGANHAFAAIRKLFNWAKERRYIERSPCEGLRLPARPISRERVLTDDEIAAIYKTAVATGYPYGSIVLLLLLTAQRRSEVATLCWSDINLESGTILLPAERTKANRTHTLPIGPIAVGVIDQIPRLNDLLFPARGNSHATFSGFSKSKRRFDEACAIADWTLHDLRRTAATHMAGLGVAPHVVERILNHTSGTISGVAAIYNRFGYQSEMRQALAAWEDKIIKLSEASGT